ncbi:hypothetical protein SteCoe_13783 [Stentor coeruleus]|uniref:Uncharacterized protein n=1 Tax=Stentor coeruleus TaxID=5963 RepID=A0A1R2C7U1_9CILI|nr:hypothetical protein SteCoe_13783 [Stentor coeruleus]
MANDLLGMSSIEAYKVLVHKCSEVQSLEIQENASDNNLLCSQIKNQYNKSKFISLHSTKNFSRKGHSEQKYKEPETSSTLKITPHDIQALLIKLKNNKKTKPTKLCSCACIIT